MDEILTTLATDIPAIAAIVLLCFVFIKAMKCQREDFKNTIDNHIEHNTNATEENSKFLMELRETIKELCIWVRKSNGNGK